MRTFRKSLIAALIFILLQFISFQVSFAQDFIKMTDQQWIELAIDMIRKGVQQQDTAKISMVSAPKIQLKQQSVEMSGVLTKKFQDIFDNSSKRKFSLRKPLFKQPTPLASSNFWDFDIVNLKIKITGDSAIADCELVLWGAVPNPGSKEVGRRVHERFVFKTSTATPSPPFPKGEGGSFENKGTKANRSYQLAGFENLIDFLKIAGEVTDSLNIRKEGK